MILHGDCLDVMPTLDAESIDAIVTDPPYGLEFMGKAWDKLGDGWRTAGGFSKPGIGDRPTQWTSFGAGDTANATCSTCGGRMRGAKKCACGEPVWMVKGAPLTDPRRAQAGRMQAWHEAWATEAIRVAKPGAYLLAFGGTRTVHRMTCAIEDAGWIIRDMLVWGYASGFPKGRANLKPAWEPIVMARKPGPLRMLNIDGCRISTEGETIPRVTGGGILGGSVDGGYDRPWKHDADALAARQVRADAAIEAANTLGRWPANVILTATEWYTLRDDIARPIRDTIAEYFEAEGLGGDDVRGLRQVVRDNASVGARRAPEVLLPTMQLEGIAGGQADGGPAHGGVAPADERGPDGQGDRAGLARLEGRTVPRPERLPDGGDLDPDGARARAGGGYGDEGLGLRPGAPAGHGNDVGSSVGPGGDRPSPQRGEGRQPAVEPVPQGSAQPFAGAPDGGPRVGAAPRARRRAGGGERRVTVPLDLIPAPWRRYFRFSHDTGIFDGGWDGVVGGGEAGDNGGGFYVQPEQGGFDGASFGDFLNEPGKQPFHYGDTGTYSRFFLVPKSSRSDREPVLGGLVPRREMAHRKTGAMDTPYLRGETFRQNAHPTVKPTDLMRHLVRLVTPPGGTVLDPFLGSGTTALAAEMEGFEWVGIEKEAEYVQIAEARLNGTQKGMAL